MYVHGLVGNMARYFIAVCKYFPDAQVRENIAHKCNVSPYCPLNQASYSWYQSQPILMCIFNILKDLHNPFYGQESVL